MSVILRIIKSEFTEPEQGREFEPIRNRASISSYPLSLRAIQKGVLFRDKVKRVVSRLIEEIKKSRNTPQSLVTSNTPPFPPGSSPLVDHPKDIQLEILKRCDLPSLANISATGIYFNELTSDHMLWRHIAVQIGNPIDSKSPLPVYKQDLTFIHDIQKKAFNIKDRPQDITKILKAPTDDQIKHIRKWMKARAKIELWKSAVTHAKAELNRDLGGPNLDNLTTSQEEINAAEKLPLCFAANQADLARLTRLYLCFKGLVSLPKEIGYFTGLQELQLQNNQLTSVPPEIGSLIALQWLSLDHNQLTSLPSEIGALIALVRLDLENNQLTSVPPEIGSLIALVRLDLSHNQLTSLPPQIGSLIALQWLDLYHNQLTSLPHQIASLIALQWLDLNHNQLISLPPQIGSLIALQWLDLSHNHLTSLPSEIGSLIALRSLHLHHNQLTLLPPQIAHLPRRPVVLAYENPLPLLTRLKYRYIYSPYTPKEELFLIASVVFVAAFYFYFY